MAAGFFISAIEIRGKTVPPATLTLRSGLNVISGASDTGKSYLVECIDYMLGGSTRPKDIDESDGYDTVLIEVTSWDATAHTLSRSLRGGDFRLFQCPIGEVGSVDDDGAAILKRKHRPGHKDTASGFFLELSELYGVQVRKNQQGQKREVSIRDVAHLCVITEERIYTTDSPVYGSVVTQRTAEKAFFRYLLTGVDDSSVVAERTPQEIKARRIAQIETVESMLEEMEQAVTALTDTPSEIDEQLTKIGDAFDELTSVVETDQETLAEIQARRTEAWSDAAEARSRLRVIERLDNRFELLQEHYSTDLRRLEAVEEAARQLGQLNVVDCPVCGAPKFGLEEIGQIGISPDLLSQACRNESRKIQLLQDDLASTIGDLNQEAELLRSREQRSTRTYSRLSDQIKTSLEPVISQNRQQMNELFAAKARLEQATGIRSQMEVLRHRKAHLETAVTKRQRSSGEASSATTSESDAFCQVVERTLSDWNFPENGRVTFSEDSQDLVIAGQDRRSHGKGIRAITYAAFVVSLMQYCRQQSRPHPGMVVLDSPLVAYKEPDSDAEKESVESYDVKGAFFRSLSELGEAMQVIVFENEDPPEEIESQIVYYHFSKNNEAGQRYGFFPSDPSKSRQSDNKDSGN